MQRTICKIHRPEEIATVSELARQIWTEHYVPIIGEEQVEYMLDEFQSPEAIRAQLASGYNYYLLEVDSEPVGYLALVPEPEDNRLMISKIYIKKSCRGAGHGGHLMEFARERSRELEVSQIWLRVNRHNDSAVNWYKEQGFSIDKKDKKNIGRGFYMDDFIMSACL